jgi:hypothetical protein
METLGLFGCHYSGADPDEYIAGHEPAVQLTKNQLTARK